MQTATYKQENGFLYYLFNNIQKKVSKKDTSIKKDLISLLNVINLFLTTEQSLSELEAKPNKLFYNHFIRMKRLLFILESEVSKRNYFNDEDIENAFYKTLRAINKTDILLKKRIYSNSKGLLIKTSQSTKDFMSISSQKLLESQS